jgi:hypothetical protein
MNAMKHPSNLVAYQRIALLLLVDCLFFGFFGPQSSAFIVIPALLLVILNIYALVKVLLYVVGRFVTIKQQVVRRITVILTGSVSILLALQSIGQLTLRDVLTLIPLMVVLYFYLSYTRRSSIER